MKFDLSTTSLAGVLASIALFFGQPVDATSEPMTECFDEMKLTGIINSDVIIQPNAWCTVDGATINGNIYLEENSKVSVINSGVVTGDIVADGVTDDAAIFVNQSTVKGTILVTSSTLWTVQLNGGSSAGKVKVEDSTFKDGFSGHQSKVLGDVVFKSVTTLDATLPAFDLEEVDVEQDVIIENGILAGTLYMHQGSIGRDLKITSTTIGGDQLRFTQVPVAGSVDMTALTVTGTMNIQGNPIEGDFQIVDTSVQGGLLGFIANNVKGTVDIGDTVVAAGNPSTSEVQIHANTAGHMTISDCVGNFGEVQGNTIQLTNLEVLSNGFDNSLMVTYNIVANTLMVIENTLSLPTLTGNTALAVETDFAN